MTGSLLPQGNRVMSLMSFHSQLYNVACVYLVVCICLCVGDDWIEPRCLCVEITDSSSLEAHIQYWVCAVCRSCPSLWFFWSGSSWMLLSCWPPLRFVTHYWNCWDHTVWAVFSYMAIISPQSGQIALFCNGYSVFLLCSNRFWMFT